MAVSLLRVFVYCEFRDALYHISALVLQPEQAQWLNSPVQSGQQLACRYGRQRFRPEIRSGIPRVTSRLSRRLPCLRPAGGADLHRESEKPQTAPVAIPQHSAAKKASPDARDREGCRPHRDSVFRDPSRRVPYGGKADSETSAPLEHRWRVLVSLSADRDPICEPQH